MSHNELVLDYFIYTHFHTLMLHLLCCDVICLLTGATAAAASQMRHKLTVV